MSCADVGLVDDTLVVEFRGRLVAYIDGKFYPAMATRESIFDLSCEGDVPTVTGPNGVAHRWPLVVMTTLCGRDFPRSWKPGSGRVTCKRCLARARKP